MLKSGYDIVVNYRKENEELETVKNEIEKQNVKFFKVQGDVSDFNVTENMVK